VRHSKIGPSASSSGHSLPIRPVRYCSANLLPPAHKTGFQTNSDGLGGTRERAESNGFVLGVQESIKLCAARFHAFGKLSLRDPLDRHHSIKLTSNHAFDRARSLLHGYHPP
jgi:hypothetical protein